MVEITREQFEIRILAMVKRIQLQGISDQHEEEWNFIAKAPEKK